MKLFKPLYEKALVWAKHPLAERYLMGISFVEAFIFPLMPEIMLAPMTLGKPERWARYASLSLLFSTLGSIIGYLMGHYGFELLRPLLDDLGWLPAIDGYVAKLRGLGGWEVFWLLVGGGFLPIPMKIIAWSSGIVGVPIWAFLAAMIVGRGKRVYLLCGAIRLGGEKAEQTVHKWIEWIGWGLLALVVLAVVYFKFLHH
ncbi:YqaA family protein [Rudaea cellulosilytica]|uniref:YqaA family protein n=1 Tax=Rudaea cellulosilytica TaxID=540746 RepID=UPI00038072F1|nr:DedA family protein [Rudaea cellulosilytica]